MGGLTNRVLHNIEERRSRILRGEMNSIPSPFIRSSDDFLGIEQAKYYVVTAGTKMSKTQFGSYVFIYTTLMYAYEHPEQATVNVFYYPLEETQEDVMTRFMCYILYKLSGYKIRVSPTDLKSTKNDKPLDIEVIELLKSEEYNNILEFFESHIIFSSSTNPTGVYNECKKYAKENGTIYYKKQKIKDELGQIKEIDAFDYYELNNPNAYNIIFIDHVSLLSTERGMSLKQTIDKLSEYCVILRNRYKFSPGVIQQQAFAGEGLDAFKENKLRSTTANLADSKYPARDANIVLGLFSPFKYELKDYMRYDITKLRDNVRFLEVLINRGGSMGGIIALYFDGAVNYFNELPPPEDPAINRVYNSLISLRRHSFISFSIKKLKNKLHSWAMSPIFVTVKYK